MHTSSTPTFSFHTSSLPQAHRIKMDRVQILQNSFDKDSGGQVSSEARKAFAMAERAETQAVTLLQSLVADKVADTARPLSVFAPHRRETLLKALRNVVGGAGPRRPARRSSNFDDGLSPNALRKRGSAVTAMHRMSSTVGSTSPNRRSARQP